jgi:hypothetical protein
VISKPARSRLTAKGFRERIESASVRRIHADAAGGERGRLLLTNVSFACYRRLPNMIQSQVPLDVIGKLNGIARFTAVRHGEVGTELFDFVFIVLCAEDRLAGSCIRRKKDKVLAWDDQY